MKLNKLFTISLSSLVILTSITGCNTKFQEEKITKISDDFTDYNKIFDEGMFYVKHDDGTFEKTYFGNASFDSGETNENSPNYEKVMWFKADFSQIPILGSGDELLMYSSTDFSEVFTLERFYDYGYSIGIRNLETTESGRYALTFSDDESYVYPDSDTSELEKLKTKKIVIDKLGGVQMLNSAAATKDKVNGNSQDNESDEVSYLTSAGTICGLQQDKTYPVEIYEGTIKHDYNLTADVRVLGEFETYTITNYEYVADKCIKIKLPEDWKSGYYCINGIGMFLYINDKDINKDDYEDLLGYDTSKELFNEAYVEEETDLFGETKTVTNQVVSDGDVYVPYSNGNTVANKNIYTTEYKYNYETPKNITVKVNNVTYNKDITIEMETPTGKTYTLEYKDGVYQTVFKTDSSTLNGVLKFKMYNVKGDNVDISLAATD